jgi:hypothetical protein
MNDPVVSRLIDTSREVLGGLDRRSADRDRILVTLGRARFGRTRRRVRGGAAALVLLAVVAVGWQRSRSERPLTYALEGGELRGGELRSGPPARLRFSDGSAVDFDAQTRVRLSSLHAGGAQLVLLDGVARLEIVHRQGARWEIDAGPYVVTVTGTAFRVAWSPRDYALDLEMQRGSVTVRGPLAENGLRLEAGHHLVARPHLGEVSVTSGPLALGHLESTSPHKVSPPMAAPVVGRAEAPARPVVSRPAPDPGVVWARRIAAGDFEGVLAAAQKRGLDATIERGSLAQLGALADAARYARQTTVAERALLALRRRFPRSVEARDSAFVLGRLEEERSQDDLAGRWYDRYLAEVPGGSYVAAAWGRKLTLARRNADDQTAAAMARQYLGRFPDGPYAALASALAGAGP